VKIGNPPLHLTYCLNVHPGESWRENFAAIEHHAAAVRAAVAPHQPFGLGLRLGAAAADELAQPRVVAEFARYLADSGMYVFTINGFPYGPFHGTPVKQHVYAPDWRRPQRLAYTLKLADILAALLPPNVPGSISTCPGAYASWIRTDADVEAMARNLTAAAEHMRRLRESTGRLVRLALEPEPDCYMQTTGEAIEFLRVRLPGGARADDATRALLAEHVGVCLDTAHAAVAFENPADSLAALRQAGVAVPKIQLSSALQCRPDAAALERLAEFADAVYLHQVKVRLSDGRMLHYPDLGDALADPAARAAGALWRVHFHVPLFFGELQHLGLASTSSLLGGRFAAALAAGACDHLEIETYTLGVLPDSLRPASAAEAIIAEFAWVRRLLAEATVN
jgi:sugar phosphate isomerase/epimerase